MFRIVETYDQVVRGVQAFNQGLAEGRNLKDRLSYVRSWYYIPELDAIGPSKFIGYDGITASQYMSTESLDGRETEPALRRWFDVLEGHEPEGVHVTQIAKSLLALYNKSLNRRARFYAPRGWKLDQPVYHKKDATQRENIGSWPLVEVFWQAFLCLSPEDRERLAERIIDRRKMDALMAEGYREMSEENVTEAEDALNVTREVVLADG